MAVRNSTMFVDTGASEKVNNDGDS
jgi:hypothetical protein